MVWKLIQFEWKNDVRNSSSIVGIILYIFTVLFFCLQSFKKTPDAMVWNNLLWVVLIFSAINSTSKNFSQYNRGRFIYLYSVTKPEHFILAKIIYTILFMLALTAITVLVYGLFLGFTPLKTANVNLYILTLLIGTIGFASILAFMSVLSVKANASNAVTAILSIPLLIPLVIAINELCALAINKDLAINGLSWDLAQSSLMVAGSVDLLVIAMAYVLFPYLWRE
jgi:heme exporter protein B